MIKEITVTTASVYDARALAELVGIANKYNSKIVLTMEKRSINAKSIMGIMGLGLDQGKLVGIEANGDDEAEAIAALEEFLSR